MSVDAAAPFFLLEFWKSRLREADAREDALQTGLVLITTGPIITAGRARTARVVTITFLKLVDGLALNQRRALYCFGTRGRRILA